MSAIPTRSQYAVALFEDDDLKVELTPISIANAANDGDAHDFAMTRAGQWMVANGVKVATLKISKDGFGLPAKKIVS